MRCRSLSIISFTSDWKKRASGSHWARASGASGSHWARASSASGSHWARASGVCHTSPSRPSNYALQQNCILVHWYFVDNRISSNYLWLYITEVCQNKLHIAPGRCRCKRRSLTQIHKQLQLCNSADRRHRLNQTKIRKTNTSVVRLELTVYNVGFMRLILSCLYTLSRP